MSWRDEDYRINVYTCTACGVLTSTVDIHEGVTPFMSGCPICGGHTRSSMYPSNRPIPDNVPRSSFEWYRPEPGKVQEIDLDHVSQGGLLRRPIQTPTTGWRRHSDIDADEEAMAETLSPFKPKHESGWIRRRESTEKRDQRARVKRKKDKANRKRGRKK